MESQPSDADVPPTRTATQVSSVSQDGASPRRSRTSSSASTSGRMRTASVRLLESNPPLGFLHATGVAAAQAPTVADIRHGSFSHGGWSNEKQLERRRRASMDAEDPSLSLTRTRSESQASPGASKPTRAPTAALERQDTLAETAAEHEFPSTAAPATHLSPTSPDQAPQPSEKSPSATSTPAPLSTTPTTYANGYRPPPKHTWAQATVIGLKGFWAFFITPFGFLLTIYGLNVVAWGGMIFLLLCNAAPAMCRPTCNAINSPRRIWIEIDSQILNALFCVTGFGLIPWRFRDLYFLLRFRLRNDHDALRRLAGINNGWFRLPGSETLDAESTVSSDPRLVPIPLDKTPDPPPTGIRAPPTALWRLDFVIWMYVANTVLQAVLSGLMWGLNRYDRPSWSTGVFVALACVAAGVGGWMAFVEGKRVKKFEGVPEGRPQAQITAREDDVESAGSDVEKREEQKRNGDA
ncbi:MAG: hypothetical protein M1833_001316 [Piccolia ochrophora]|nr:MAG: hypothetical protein M1833_001316 [Piccolia ochrophora]